LFFPDLKSLTLDKKRLILFLILTLTVLFFNLYYFKSIWWVGSNDFGFKYIFQTKGFFVENVAGAKTGLVINPFFIIRTIGRVVVAAFLVSLFYFKLYKKLVNPYLILLLVYLSTFLIIEKIYDRYLLPAFPIALIAISNMYLIKSSLSRLRRWFLIVYLLFLGFITYNFSADYILTNNYIWSKSEELVASNQALRSNITATDAWRYISPRKSEKFKFTYDNPSIYNHSVDCDLVETYYIKYPLQLFGNSIYLYKHKVE
jgi:hypothetical protein